MATIKTKSLKAEIKNASRKARGAWARGVALYALDICDNLLERGIAEISPRSPAFVAQCLNGAADWRQYSDGGCALIYDSDIAERLCNASEKKRYDAGRLERPNSRESWLDCQARALYQAFALMVDCGDKIAASTRAA